MSERTLYAPTFSRETRRDVLIETMRANPFACIVTPDADGLKATHVPVMIKEEAGDCMLEFHVARANDHWRLAGGKTETLAIFQGPQAYIHPGWYASKAEHGRVVPTWCYVTVHARGRLETIGDEAALRRHLDELTASMEAERTEPWAVSDAPAEYVGRQSKAISGLRLRVERLEGAWKLNQHKSEADRAGAINGLTAENGTCTAEIADRMRAALAQQTTNETSNEGTGQ